MIKCLRVLESYQSESLQDEDHVITEEFIDAIFSRTEHFLAWVTHGYRKRAGGTSVTDILVVILR